MEQIRIIKEMREHEVHCGRTDESIRPRYMVWENVCGAFSSNGGEDFRAVLEETARVVTEDAVIPRPEKGKWSYAGCIMGDGWSIAWRTHDAQFWGVPQRRRRISLVADFGGNTAPEILFECNGMSGDIEESGVEGQGATEDAERCSGDAIAFLEMGGKPGGGKGILISDERTGSLNQQCGQNVCYNAWDVQSKRVFGKDSVAGTLNSGTFEGKNIVPSVCYNPWDIQSKHIQPEGGVAESLYSGECRYGGGESYVMQSAVPLENHPNDSRMKICEDGKVQTLSSRMGTGGNNTPMILEPMLLESNQNHATVQTDGVSTSLPASMGMGGGYVPMVVNEPMLLENTQDHGTVNTSGCCTTLTARMGTGGNNIPMVKPISQNIIRRLTPLECERLQGYPDGWTDIGDWTDSNGKKHKGDSDSPRYKALGNSIALPFWQWMAGRMAEHLPEKATMASLFDGIGGFPLVYSRVGVKPIWASEIEEFPIAVTKLRFPEEGEDYGTESNT